jgi:hypothetical protein
LKLWLARIVALFANQESRTFLSGWKKTGKNACPPVENWSGLLMRHQGIMGDFWGDCQPVAPCRRYGQHVFNPALGRGGRAFFRDFSVFSPWFL